MADGLARRGHNRRVGKVRVAQVFPVSVHEAERCWYDTARWPRWVDGLGRVLSVDLHWPKPGSEVVWESGPAGRGRVRERVLAHVPLGGQTVEVEDDSLRGRQAVSFDPAGGGVEVTLTLEYAIKRRWLLTPLIDRLFVRRPMATSLAKTLHGLGEELAESRQPGVR
jgi:hypothetical protein